MIDEHEARRVRRRLDARRNTERCKRKAANYFKPFEQREYVLDESMLTLRRWSDEQLVVEMSKQWERGGATG